MSVDANELAGLITRAADEEVTSELLQSSTFVETSWTVDDHLRFISFRDELTNAKNDNTQVLWYTTLRLSQPWLMCARKYKTCFAFPSVELTNVNK